MDKHTAIAVQNGRVWARRLGVDFDQAIFLEEYSANFNGSVLSGPLKLIFSKKLKNTTWSSKLENHDRRALASILANTLTNLLRTDVCSNILSELALATNSDREKSLFAMYSPELANLIAIAITARTREKQKPNLTNTILKKIRA